MSVTAVGDVRAAAAEAVAAFRAASERRLGILERGLYGPTAEAIEAAGIAAQTDALDALYAPDRDVLDGIAAALVHEFTAQTAHWSARVAARHDLANDAIAKQRAAGEAIYRLLETL